MNIEDIAVELQKTDDRSIRNEGRIEKLEKEGTVLHQLVTSVAVMAEQMKTMNANVKTLTTEVEQIKEKPAKRWETIIGQVIVGIVALGIGYIASKLGL